MGFHQSGVLVQGGYFLGRLALDEGYQVTVDLSQTGQGRVGHRDERLVGLALLLGCGVMVLRQVAKHPDGEGTVRCRSLRQRRSKVRRS